MNRPKSKSGIIAVTGILSNIVVQSIHIVDRSPSAEKAATWLSNHPLCEDEVKYEYHQPKHDRDLPIDRKHNIAHKSVTSHNELVSVNSIKSKSRTYRVEYRKQLRVQQKQQIRDHLESKPRVSKGTETPTVANTGGESKRDCESILLSDTAKYLLLLEDNLTAVQEGYNRHVLEAARKKISLRDKIQQQNERILDLSDLLGEKVQMIDLTSVKLHPGENIHEYQSDGKRVEEPLSIFKLYLRGTVYDNEFLFHGGVDLSQAADAVKVKAKTYLQDEKARITEAIRLDVTDFERLLCHVRKEQFETTLMLKLGKLKHSIVAEQLEALIEFDSSVDRLQHIVMDSCIRESEIEKMRMSKERKLQTIRFCGVLPVSSIHLSHQFDNNDNPVIFSVRDLEELNGKSNELQTILDGSKSRLRELRCNKKVLNKTIQNLKNELSHYENMCREIQVQKFGKPVEPGVLDITHFSNQDNSDDTKIHEEDDCYNAKDVLGLKKEQKIMKDQLLTITEQNTQLLRDLASLREQHMNINENIKCARTSVVNDDKVSNTSNIFDETERKRFLKMSRDQKKEIDMLHLEIQSLKTKRGKN